MENEVNQADIDMLISDAPVAEPGPEPPAQEPPASEPAAPAGVEPAPDGEPTPGEPPPPSASPASPAPSAEPAPASAPEGTAAEPPAAVDERDNIISALRAQLEEVSAKLVQAPGQPAPAVDGLPAAAPDPAAQPAADVPVLEFVKDDAAFDEALKSHTNFNRLLTGVVYKSIESTLRSVPAIVTRLADQQITARSAINEFYSNNKDLVPVKGFVGTVAQDMAAKNPTWKIDDLLANLGKEVRTRLKMGGSAILNAPQGAPGVPPPPANGPAFAGTGGGANRTVSDQRSTLQKDIDDLISDN